MKKVVYGVLLVAAVLTIFLLTFQDAAGTVKLSEGLRLWLERFGLKSDFHTFRSNAHLVLYFLFGIALCLYGRECGWSWWAILAVGCCVGLIDESIKVLLPTREFDFVDLVKDWVGVSVAAGTIAIIKRTEAR
ncbi:MAG: VanZ family protein [Eubacteriales bacterium]